MEPIEEALLEYATYIFDKVQKSPGIREFGNIPIREIDGMPVMVNYKIHHNNIIIEILGTDCGCSCIRGAMWMSNFHAAQLTAMNIYDELNKFTIILDDLKYCKMSGQLESTPSYYPVDCRFLKSPNIKSRYEECCVCYEITSTKTQCNHPLCLKCWSQIVEVREEDEFEQHCPICRVDLQQCDH